MPSPFPGMDPYLEGYLWTDVHQGLASEFRKQLAPLVEPHYAVRSAVTMHNDRVPAHELGIMYPDDEIVRFNVQAALNTLYDEARYTLTLNYDQPPPEPALSEADAAWAAECVKKWREQ
jgi:hypothetical protein